MCVVSLSVLLCSTCTCATLDTNDDYLLLGVNPLSCTVLMQRPHSNRHTYVTSACRHASPTEKQSRALHVQLKAGSDDTFEHWIIGGMQIDEEFEQAITADVDVVQQQPLDDTAERVEQLADVLLSYAEGGTVCMRVYVSIGC